MESLLAIAPLVLLLAVAVYLIRRGSRTKPDADGNAADIGGGSGDNRSNE